MSLNNYHADDIAAAMAEMLEDEGFTRLYRKAFDKTAGVLEGLQADLANTKTSDECEAVYQKYDKPDRSDGSTPLSRAENKMPGTYAKARQMTELRKRQIGQGPGGYTPGTIAPTDDGQSADDSRIIPESTGDPIQGIEMTDEDIEKEYGISTRPQKANDSKCDHGYSEACPACDGIKGKNEVDDAQLAVAMNFAVRRLNKIANALDIAGFPGVAQCIDTTASHISEHCPKISIAAKKGKKKESGKGKSGRSYKEWVKAIPAGKDRDAFQKRYKGALEHAKKKGMKGKKAEEYAARTAIDKLPKKYLKEPTGVHGSGKSGPKVKKGKK